MLPPFGSLLLSSGQQHACSPALPSLGGLGWRPSERQDRLSKHPHQHAHQTSAQESARARRMSKRLPADKHRTICNPVQGAQLPHLLRPINSALSRVLAFVILKESLTASVAPEPSLEGPPRHLDGRLERISQRRGSQLGTAGRIPTDTPIYTPSSPPNAWTLKGCPCVLKQAKANEYQCSLPARVGGLDPRSHPETCRLILAHS